MRKISGVAGVAGVAAVLTVMMALPAGGQGPYHNPVRRHYWMTNGIPDAYVDARNPLRPTPENLRAGKALYAQNCQSCYGTTGMGNGPAGKDLNPPPPALAGGRMPMIDDGYWMWAVSEGGKALGTGMPAFKETLTLTQRWQVLLNLERGLPTPRWGQGPHMRGGPMGPGKRPGMGRGMGPGMGGQGMDRGMGPGMGGPPDDE